MTKNGRGVFGAHIAAFNPKTGELVGNFSLNDEGRFGIEGLAPGPYVIRVEPLDDADPESFFESDTAGRRQLSRHIFRSPRGCAEWG